ncbi:MAG: hypothetical protein IJW06_03210 [Clostridia bacterium]|nr:hypothetical protein [Clostridia bacterium]
MKEKIYSLLNDIKDLKNKNPKDYTLTDNVYYLNETDILCLERFGGESRYPYEMDGLNLWVHSTGYINANESNFVIFRTASQQEEPSVEFWGSIKKDGQWIPISITGATKQLFEPVKVERYLVYTKRAAYYIAETDECIFSLRVNITSEKKINFLLSAIGKTLNDIEVKFTSYIDPLVRYANNEDSWCFWNRHGFCEENGSFKIVRIPSPENTDTTLLTNCAVINKSIIAKDYSLQSTVSKADFFGGSGRCLFNSRCLASGKFENVSKAVNTVSLPAACDIITIKLSGGEEALTDYLVSAVHDEKSADALVGLIPNLSDIDKDLAGQEKEDDELLGNLSIEFDTLKGTDLNNKVFNRFVKNIQKQVSFCALGKNYVGELLGVRDVFQQLTSTSLWNTTKVREKIVKALNFIMDTGRSPRQFSVPPSDDIIPKFDIRQFIDQGLWVIETLHKYISITGDYTILDEMCSYYTIIDEKRELYKKSEIRDSVLDHLVRITDYLVSNIDDRTGCLKILYGDWNDSVNGLGESIDGKSEFGTGVSIMATLQLYKLLSEMVEILSAVKKYDGKITTYSEKRTSIAEGLEKHSFQLDGTRRHILHGWGDKGAYNVGSLCDTDGQKRFSTNPYSFWCICHMIDRDLTLKKDILLAYDALDSKYGIKTFDKHFPKGTPGIGRISNLTPGTHENGATYIHATMFAVMALFIIGEGKRAWEQIFKTLPITHESVSKSPFVMPNCYYYNEDYHLDGQSAGDWYTGSGAVLMRCIIEHAMGFLAYPEGLKIAPPNYMPSDKITMKILLKNSNFTFKYTNKNSGTREYLVNGVKKEKLFDEVSGSEYIWLSNEEISGDMIIEVID